MAFVCATGGSGRAVLYQPEHARCARRGRAGWRREAVRARRAVIVSGERGGLDSSSDDEGSRSGLRGKPPRELIERAAQVPSDEEIEDVLENYYKVPHHLHSASECDVSEGQQACWEKLNAIPLKDDQSRFSDGT